MFLAGIEGFLDSHRQTGSTTLLRSCLPPQMLIVHANEHAARHTRQYGHAACGLASLSSVYDRDHPVVFDTDAVYALVSALREAQERNRRLHDDLQALRQRHLTELAGLCRELRGVRQLARQRLDAYLHWRGVTRALWRRYRAGARVLRAALKWFRQPFGEPGTDDYAAWQEVYSRLREATRKYETTIDQ